MKNTYSIVSLLSSFVRLSPLHQFWLNLLIPVVGIILFHWTPGAVLFCFVVELINYWLCNTVLLLFFVSNESFKIRIANALKFSFWNIVCLIGFYFAIAHLSDFANIVCLVGFYLAIAHLSNAKRCDNGNEYYVCTNYIDYFIVLVSFCFISSFHQKQKLYEQCHYTRCQHTINVYLLRHVCYYWVWFYFLDKNKSDELCISICNDFSKKLG
jgi:hypothetical protein